MINFKAEIDVSTFIFDNELIVKYCLVLNDYGFWTVIKCPKCRRWEMVCLIFSRLNNSLKQNIFVKKFAN